MNRFFSARNQLAWQQMQEQQEALLVGYLIAGDPTTRKSIKIVENVLLAGVDILELGVPSNYPYLDGEVIQSGHARVRKDKDITEWLLHYWGFIRQYVKKPIWAMGYKVDLIDTGLYQTLAIKGLIDALVLPDCTFAQNIEIASILNEYGIDIVQLVQADMSDAELAQICNQATIIYAQTYVGTTGNMHTQLADLAAFYERIRANTSALIVTGFGLHTPEKVRYAVESRFDGVVVGSALVACCAEENQDVLYQLITEMKKETNWLK